MLNLNRAGTPNSTVPEDVIASGPALHPSGIIIQALYGLNFAKALDMGILYIAGV